MGNPAIAPYVPAYANRVPYITVDEFLAANTGVDTSQLRPGGSYGDNRAILKMVIGRASSWVDSICFQTVAATAEVKNGRYRMRGDGTIHVPLPFSPIVAVTSVGYGWSIGSTLTAISDPSAAVWIEDNVAIIDTGGGVASTGRLVSPSGDTLFVVVGYIAGFANTCLAADAAIGATQVTVASGLAIAAGIPMTIYDAASTEDIAVGGAHVFDSATVELAAPLTYAHTKGTAISALPPAIKQAALSLGACLVKVRGAQSLSMPSIDAQPTRQEVIQAGGMADLEVAEALLVPFTRVV